MLAVALQTLSELAYKEAVASKAGATDVRNTLIFELSRRTTIPEEVLQSCTDLRLAELASRIPAVPPAKRLLASARDGGVDGKEKLTVDGSSGDSIFSLSRFVCAYEIEFSAYFPLDDLYCAVIAVAALDESAAATEKNAVHEEATERMREYLHALIGRDDVAGMAVSLLFSFLLIFARMRNLYRSHVRHFFFSFLDARASQHIHLDAHGSEAVRRRPRRAGSDGQRARPPRVRGTIFLDSCFHRIPIYILFTS